VDFFAFQGEEGQQVTITLEASEGQTGRATLLLKDATQDAGQTISSDPSSLPNEVTATLPASGEYHIGVLEQPRSFLLAGQIFRGDYCVTVDTSPAAAPALLSTASVEGQGTGATSEAGESLGRPDRIRAGQPRPDNRKRWGESRRRREGFR
jgi:hypothetical protein